MRRAVAVHSRGYWPEDAALGTVTLAYIDGLIVLAIAASIMFLLAFIVRRNDPGGGGHVVAE